MTRAPSSWSEPTRNKTNFSEITRSKSSFSEVDKNKTAFSEASRSKGLFSERNSPTYNVVLDPVPFDESTVNINDNDCFFDGPKVTETYPTGEEKTGWSE